MPIKTQGWREVHPSSLSSAQNPCPRLQNCVSFLKEALAWSQCSVCAWCAPTSPGVAPLPTPQLLSCSVIWDISQFSPIWSHPKPFWSPRRGQEGSQAVGHKGELVLGHGTGMGDRRAAGTIPSCCPTLWCFLLMLCWDHLKTEARQN